VPIGGTAKGYATPPLCTGRVRRRLTPEGLRRFGRARGREKSRRATVRKNTPRHLYNYQKKGIGRIGVCKCLKRRRVDCSFFARWESRVRKTGRKARNSETEVGGAGCIELSHKIMVCIYLPVKTNRKYNKTRRIAEYKGTTRGTLRGREFKTRTLKIEGCGTLPPKKNQNQPLRLPHPPPNT
jgi:hypothetical protein